MYGGGYGQYGGGMGAAIQEIRSDMWINQNIPGGVNSKSNIIFYIQTK